MTKLQEKAEAQVKQIVGQMIGDDQLVQEGKEQQHQADEAEPAANSNPAKEKASHVQPAGPGSEQKR